MNLSGHKYGMLTAVRFIDIVSGRSIYECKCDCGVIVAVKAKYLLNGDTKSCGCLKSISSAKTARNLATHNLSKHPLFKIWDSMKYRCLNPNCHAYPDYGGRGIKVSDEWMDFHIFFNDVSPTYVKGLELDRFPDNNGNYCKENFRWATPTMNKRNRRDSIFLIVDGVKKHIAEWAEETGISRQSIWCRINRGKEGSEALFGSQKTKAA